jgi:hypothetical protein
MTAIRGPGHDARGWVAATPLGDGTMTNGHGAARWLLFGALAASTLCLLGETAPGGEPQGVPEDPAKLISALATTNSPPKVVMLDRGPEGSVPVFPKDFDWKEQERVFAALGRLARDTRMEVWDAALRSTGDRRYCLTVKDLIDNPKNCTVGDFCWDVVSQHLCYVYLRHLPAHPTKNYYLFFLPDGVGPLDKWREQRKDKAMYELQIDVCEAAIAQLGKEKDVSEKEVQKAKVAIEAEIKKLRESKKPIYRAVLPLGEIDAYSPEDLPKIAERLKREK